MGNARAIGREGQIRKQTKILRAYFNNHNGGKAVFNALQFKAMNGMVFRYLTVKQRY
jgi:hypothetical protein